MKQLQILQYRGINLDKRSKRMNGFIVLIFFLVSLLIDVILSIINEGKITILFLLLFVVVAGGTYLWRLILHVIYKIKSEKKSVSYEICVKGVDLLSRHNYSGAISEFDKAIAKDPNCYEAFADKGVALSKLNRHEEAISEFDKAIAIKPKNKDAIFNKGLALYYAKKYEDAIRVFDLTMKINPNFSGSFYRKGTALSKLNRHEEAVSEFDKAIAITYDFPEAWYDRGLSLNRLKQHDKAKHSFGQALRLRPDNSDYKKAVDDFEK